MDCLTSEQTLVGLCLNRRTDLLEVVAAGITANHFEEDLCRDIFMTMHGLLLEDKPTDFQTVAVKMSGKGAQVVQLSTAAYMTTADVKVFAEAILDRFRDRNILRVLNDIGSAIRHKLEVEKYAAPELTNQAIDRIFTEIGKEATLSKSKRIQDVIKEVGEQWEEEFKLKDNRHFVPTGFAKLDRVLNGGVPKGAVMTIGASTGRGKSFYAINIAAQAALAGFKVLYVTIEMNSREIFERIVADKGNCLYSKVIRPDRGEEEFNAFHAVSSTYFQRDLEILDDTNGEITRVERQVRFAHEVKPFDLVVIDYIQQYQVRPNKFQHEKMRELSQYIKLNIAKKYNVAVVAPAQMNRMAECEGIEGLRTGNIADAASIERDSDIVAFIAHENPKKPSAECISLKVDPENFCWIKIGKQRKGISNYQIPMRFNGKYARFEEL